MLSESSTYQFDRYYFVISHPHLDGSEYPEILLGQVAQYLYVQLHPEISPHEQLTACLIDVRCLGQR